jgi:hypothetical protein
VVRWGPFRCLVLFGLVISFCNKILYNEDIGVLCLYSDRMYDNLILGIHTMADNHHLQLKKKEFKELKQGSLSVSEYVTHFTQLSRYAPDNVDTNEKKQD